METSDNQTTTEETKAQEIVRSESPIADTAMATGTDNEPEMTIADKHTGEPVPDLDGDGKLTRREAATLLGDSEPGSGETK